MAHVSDQTSELRVVAAVDGSEHSRRALRRAAEEARAHDATLEVVYAWDYLDQPRNRSFDPNYCEEVALAELERIVADELGDDRPAKTVLRAINDLPARAVLEAGSGAWVIVLGARGVGGFKGLLLGSVSHQVVQHSSCPVLIVH
jgi:nucleotide-binding universal stress UspA family protein